MAVDRHAQPFRYLSPGDGAELRFRVSRHYSGRADPRGQHPDRQPAYQGGLTDSASRTDRQPQRLEVYASVVGVDVIAQFNQHLALPFAWAFKMLKWRIRLPPREG